MNGRNLKKVLTALTMAALIPTAGWAVTAPTGPRSQAPPPEALSACEGKKSGDPVQFANRRGEQVEGVCREMDGRMVAMRGDGPRSGGKMFRGKGERQHNPVERLTATLELTEAQQEQVKQIFASEREKIAPLWEKKKASQEQIQAAIHSGQADDHQLRALAAAQAEIQAELLVSRAAAWKQVNALLTPEQQERAKKMQFGPRGKKGGHRSCN